MTTSRGAEAPVQVARLSDRYVEGLSACELKAALDLRASLSVKVPSRPPKLRYEQAVRVVSIHCLTRMADGKVGESVGEVEQWVIEHVRKLDRRGQLAVTPGAQANLWHRICEQVISGRDWLREHAGGKALSRPPYEIRIHRPRPVELDLIDPQSGPVHVEMGVRPDLLVELHGGERLHLGIAQLVPKGRLAESVSLRMAVQATALILGDLEKPLLDSGEFVMPLFGTVTVKFTSAYLDVGVRAISKAVTRELLQTLDGNVRTGVPNPAFGPCWKCRYRSTELCQVTAIGPNSGPWDPEREKERDETRSD